MSDLTLQDVVMRVCAVLLIAAVHGFAVARIACLLGDQGPRHDERLSVGPWRHVDPIGGLLTVFFTFGWIRPITIDPGQLRTGRLGSVIVVLGASCATLLLAVLPRLIRPFVLNLLGNTEAATFFIFVETLGQLCVSFAMFNLLPLPPLTGQHLLAALFPDWRDGIAWVRVYASVALGLLIVSGVAAGLLAPALSFLTRVILGD